MWPLESVQKFLMPGPMPIVFPALLMEQAYRAHLQGGITVYAGILFDGDASDPGLTALGEGFQEPTGILQRSCFGRVIWFLLF